MSRAGSALWRARYRIARRTTQIAVLLVLMGTARWGWAIGEREVAAGDLSASTILGVVPLADPFAVLQILATAHVPELSVSIGALVVLIFYGLVGGRVFCAWVCPVNPIADAAAWTRERMRIRGGTRLPRSLRRWLLGLTLVVSGATGVAAFELVSPIGMVHRAFIFGAGGGLFAVAALFSFDAAVVERGWCGRICPLGAFYGLLGRLAQVRVAFDVAACTDCGECKLVCHEPQVLDLKAAATVGMIAAGDCSNCGRCIPVCPEGALRFGLRSRIRHDSNTHMEVDL